MRKEFKKLGFSFLPIPEELMRSKAISFGAKFLFGIIAKANKEKVNWPIQYLSKRMDCHRRETSRRIKELKDNNLITVIDKKGKVNEYKVNFELIHIIQTPDQSGIGKKSHRGNANNSHRSQVNNGHTIKEHFLKNINKEGLNKFKTMKTIALKDKLSMKK